MKASKITIQKATPSDLPRLFEISAIVHAVNYTELIPATRKKDFFKRYERTRDNRERYVNSIQEKLTSPSYKLFTAKQEGGLVIGYISGEVINTKTFEIRSLFVDPHYQGVGVGTKLMHEIAREFGNKEAYLFVIEGNQGAINLYKKFGFDFEKHISDKTFFGAQLLYMSRRPRL